MEGLSLAKTQREVLLGVDRANNLCGVDRGNGIGDREGRRGIAWRERYKWG
jgi:hypothetical protein